MVKRLFSLIAFGLFAFLISTYSFADPSKAPMWKDLKVEEQQALAPVAQDYDKLPDGARLNFYKAAQRYPKLTPVEKARFKSQITEWAKMHPEERKKAREKYKKYKELPPEKRKEVKEKWHERESKKAPTANPAPVTPSKPVEPVLTPPPAPSPSTK